MSDFKKLDVWRAAHGLSTALAVRVASFPQEERFDLARQMRRAARSIGANIAEGSGRQGDRELVRYARIARGSAHELENHLLVARDCQLLGEDEWRSYDETVQRISRMLTGLIRMRLRQNR